jgi:hypothetical protein
LGGYGGQIYRKKVVVLVWRSQSVLVGVGKWRAGFRGGLSRATIVLTMELVGEVGFCVAWMDVWSKRLLRMSWVSGCVWHTVMSG